MARRTALERHELAQKLVFVLRVPRNELHDDLPDSVSRRATASISIKSCFVALLLWGSSTP